MIKIDRTKVDCPEILRLNVTPTSQGEIETRDTIVFFSDLGNHDSKYQKMGVGIARTQQSYSVYSDKSVRKALKEMSYGKCAYCESKITAIYNGDVEHFRPKAGYNNVRTDAVSKPGYYWLSSDWENLLFACPFCNQTNTHEITDGNNVTEVVQGKLNQFPLIDNSIHRLDYTHGNQYFVDRNAYQIAYDLEETERLLLKPCTDEIEKHFVYDEEGLIYKSLNLIELERNRAETSIKVYALQRLGLVQTRREKVIQIKAQIRRVEQATKNYSSHLDRSEEEKVWFEGILREEMQILNNFKNPEQEYAGLARYIIEKYFAAFAV